MTVHVLVVAAGRGTRAGPGGPKQYRDLGGRCVLRRTLEGLAACRLVDRVRVVIHQDDRAAYETSVSGLAETGLPLDPPVPGGADRQESVRLGLEALARDGAGAEDLVLIHDAARPFASPALTARVIEALRGGAPAAFPALPVADSLRRVEAGLAGADVPRHGIARAQTPQGFAFAAILDAHRAAASACHTDDVGVAVAAGLDAVAVPGEEGNFKLTTAEDFARAGAQLGLSGAAREYRSGTGFDVHAFAEGASVILCGVEIPFHRTLSGHSDADVGMHALTDAIFGALAEGDIGQWFPPSDPQWKGAASDIFLAKAVERVAARGGRLINADVTLICEAPKIGPYSAEMRTRLSGILRIEATRVSVKATTTERLGFPGRGEGIAALASATIALPVGGPGDEPGSEAARVAGAPSGDVETGHAEGEVCI